MGQENIFLGLGVILSIALLSGGHQGLPPGVNPQHYQQGMHQVPQMQQVPVQHHPQQGVPMQQQPQMHMQQQQMHVPQQQMHMQQPQMQMQPGQPQMQHVQPQMQHPQQQMQHGQPHMQPAHGHHPGQPQVLNVANIQHEKEHIAEHMAVPIDTSKMTEQELQFHYFKMHDADNNNKLDGCELIKSLIHWHEQGHINEASGQKPAQPKSFKDEELVNLIDPILSLDDTNSDGFIDYPEFVRSQQKAAASAGTH
ncbi:50 kDa gamma-zein-like isoform X2 [Cimex lectularius]|uniref:EF-hand domain-containing protein n=1 Tax=Cimex lectularius TaxID=79782 RepID=A0A8I6RMC5_CIMLE|nr:50 kDa gamma-zein-like isoform X2 [Cimex lectularius]